jgi:hypothetical protein
MGFNSAFKVLNTDNKEEASEVTMAYVPKGIDIRLHGLVVL